MLVEADLDQHNAVQFNQIIPVAVQQPDQIHAAQIQDQLCVAEDNQITPAVGNL